DDGRLLPPQSCSQLGGRGPQLPDRAPPVPTGPAHALRPYRQDRAAQRGAARRPLRHAALAARGAPVALPAPAHDGPNGRPGGARNGLKLRSDQARDFAPRLWEGAVRGVEVEPRRMTMYASGRTYAGNAGLADTLAEHEDEIRQVIRGINGFKAHSLVKG